MGRAKVDAVVENWFPRFLANGLDYLDVSRTLARVQDWSDWAPAWMQTADDYEARGRAALAAGRRVTAAEHLRRAALTIQFAQFVLTEDPQQRTHLRRRLVETYALAAPLLDPPAARIEIPLDAGTLVGYLRRPEGVTAPALVVLIPGLESTKEQFSTFEPFFLRRGIATLSIEGPGQGECGLTLPFRSETYAAAVHAVGEHIGALTDISLRTVALGTSFGGYLALRYATLLPGLRGVVDIAGPYDLADFDRLQDVTKDSFREFVGAADLDETERLLGDVTLDGWLDRLQVPVYVLHGERDRIIDPANAHRIAAALGERATVHLEPEGGHSCQNLSTIVRPAVADWVTERLESP